MLFHNFSAKQKQAAVNICKARYSACKGAFNKAVGNIGVVQDYVVMVGVDIIGDKIDIVAVLVGLKQARLKIFIVILIIN